VSALTKQGITNTLALPIDKMLYIYVLCPHSELIKSVPIKTVKTLSPKKAVLIRPKLPKVGSNAIISPVPVGGRAQ
jgi:hypothetical protein